MPTTTIENPLIKLRITLKNLGYAKVSIKPVSYKRIEVYTMNGEQIGFYDLIKDMFVIK